MNASDETADLIVVDRHIEELNRRIDGLKERMATMTSQRYETKNQLVLLSTMEEVLKDLKLLRAEMEMLASPGCNEDRLQDRKHASGRRGLMQGAGRGQEFPFPG